MGPVIAPRARGAAAWYHQGDDHAPIPWPPIRPTNLASLPVPPIVLDFPNMSNGPDSNTQVGAAGDHAGDAEPSADTHLHNVDDGDIPQDNVIAVGDVGGVPITVKSVKDKKIPSHQRTTSPYMTKYERARVVGARATQIRYGICSSPLLGFSRLTFSFQQWCSSSG